MMLEKHEVQRLLDIAFLGFSKGQAKHARDIVAGLDQLLADSVELEICRAAGFYTVNQHEEARQVLDKALEQFPDNSMAVVYLALVDILEEKFDDAKSKISRVIEKGDDKAASALGETLLKELV